MFYNKEATVHTCRMSVQITCITLLLYITVSYYNWHLPWHVSHCE